jgi:sugar lactone lactonase YvrE
MRRMLGVVLLAAGMMIATGTAAASTPRELTLPGPAFYPESITAAPNGALFVSSLGTGEIVRFAPGSSRARTFVSADVNVNTAGVMVDPRRNVLWACAVDLTFETPSALRAFDLRTGELEASYPMPLGGLCADIALARGDVYVTDTFGGRIVRLTGAELVVWASDERFRASAPAFLGVNGIAFDGRRTLYTTNYSTGELFAVRIGADGAAEPAVSIPVDPSMRNPDGIRWHDGQLYVADNMNGLLRVNPRTGMSHVIDDSLDQPTSLVFVGDDVWVTEGQVLLLQQPEPMPHLPFTVVRLSR